MRPLLHIGYHKTGTTWLQKRVFPDEGAGFSFVGDPRAVLTAFFLVDPFDFDPETARKRFRRKIGEAEERGLVPVISHERLSGSPYAGGHDGRVVADRLAAAFPGARVLVAIREQTDVILSIYKQYLAWGGAASLEQFLTPPPGINRMPVFRYAFYEYHRLISHYHGLFGAENVLVLPYELLLASPGDFLGRIGAFVGTSVVVPERERDNVSLSALSLALKRRANRLLVRDALNPAPPFEREGANRRLFKAGRRLDERVPVWLLKAQERRWRQLVEDKVGDRYAGSNALTAKLTGLDLESLGYPTRP